MHFVVYISHLFTRSIASLASPAAPPQPLRPPPTAYLRLPQPSNLSTQPHSKQTQQA